MNMAIGIFMLVAIFFAPAYFIFGTNGVRMVLISIALTAFIVGYVLLAVYLIAVKP